MAAVMDLYSRRIVGWSMKANMTSQLVTDALMMALHRRGRPLSFSEGNCTECQEPIALQVPTNSSLFAGWQAKRHFVISTIVVLLTCGKNTATTIFESLSSGLRLDVYRLLVR